jgi:hypothetical protein
MRNAVTLLRVIEDVGEVAFTAVLTVVHGSHEDAGTALSANVSIELQSASVK